MSVKEILSNLPWILQARRIVVEDGKFFYHSFLSFFLSFFFLKFLSLFLFVLKLLLLLFLFYMLLLFQ